MCVYIYIYISLMITIIIIIVIISIIIIIIIIMNSVIKQSYNDRRLAGRHAGPRLYIILKCYIKSYYILNSVVYYIE